MKRTASLSACVVCLSTLALGHFACASMDVTTDFKLWSYEVGSFHTIDFTGFSHGMPITTQYEDQGVVFTGGVEQFRHDQVEYPIDGEGLFAEPWNDVIIKFDQPHLVYGQHFGYQAQLDFFLGDKLVFSSGVLGKCGCGFFAGFISDLPFDQIIVNNPVGNPVEIDNLYYVTVPAPASLACFLISGLCLRRRRR